MNIVMAAAENGAIEGGKVGGIGDVVRDIPLALADAGHTVQVVCPAYGLFCKRPEAILKAELSVAFAGKSEIVQVFSYKSAHTKVKYWVLEHPIFALGGIGAVYCNDPDNRPFATDAIKFALFSAAVAEAVIQNVFAKVDVLHLHDWHAALIAVPFVPGIEIGLSLILMRGPSIALYVYLATILGLMLAYLVGRYLPYAWLRRLLLDFRLVRAGQMIDRINVLTPAKRLELMREGLPKWCGPHFVRWRYVALGLLINIPGNALIGGGGGITMIAGLSRVFAPFAAFATIIVAVSPVPILIWFFGIELFS